MARNLVKCSCWVALFSVAFLKFALLLGTRHGQPDVIAVPISDSELAQGPIGMQSIDRHFIEMMIPHHDGAIAMAELALTSSRRAQIRALAQQIKTSQRAENVQMRRWYRQWFGSDGPTSPIGFGRGMGGMGASLKDLKRSADFDRSFIENMIPHHRMGVIMASHGKANSQHHELRELQALMVNVQSREIEQMEKWYQIWYMMPGKQ